MFDRAFNSARRRFERLDEQSYRLMQFGLDLSVLCAALGLAYLLRFDFQVPDHYFRALSWQLPAVVILQWASLWLAGAYRLVWRYIGLGDLPVFLRAMAYSGLPLVSARYLLPESLPLLRVPLSVILFDAVLAFGGLLCLRVVRRAVHEAEKRDRTTIETPADREPVILVGAGHAGVLSVREISRRRDMDIHPVAFVDDDPLKRGSVIGGVEVMGTTADLPQLVRALKVDHVVITIADGDPANIRRIVDICERIPVKVRTIPGYYDLLQGKVSIQRIRDVEIDDLLGRESVDLDEDRLQAFLTGRRVLVTGAGGSIGSELARQVARFQPRRLLLVDRAEFALFEAHRRLHSSWPGLEILPVLADAGDEDRMRPLLEQHRPEVLFHAAAHKHVPLVELNPGEAVKNNVLCTLRLGELAGQTGVGHFVLVSTDKAVRPTSVMGATKRVAELVMQELDRCFETRYVAVRFGNVLGSAGSVVPIFSEQIKKGGPVTVTHPEMTRYFMSIGEATQLVLSAATLGAGGEIFVLDMGEPMSILELAEKMVKLSGFVPHDEIEIVFTGKRPGEKLHEELSLGSEGLTPTENPKVFIGKLTHCDGDELRLCIERLRDVADHGDAGAVRRLLSEFLAEADLVVPEVRATP